MAFRPNSEPESQIVSIPLAGSLDTKTDEVQVRMGDFIQIENGIYDTLKRVSPRNGYLARTLFDIDGNPVSNGQAQGLLNDEECIIADRTLYGYAPQQDRYVSRGTISDLTVSERSIVKTAYIQTAGVSASLSGVTVYAWEDSRGGLWTKVLDEQSGTVYLQETQLDSISTSPKVLVCGTKLVIFAVDTSFNCHRWVIDPVTPDVVPGAVLTFASADLVFDMATAIPGIGTPCIVYGSNSILKRLDMTTFAVLTSAAGPGISAFNVSAVSVSTFGDTGMMVTVCWNDDFNGFYIPPAVPQLHVKSYFYNSSNLGAISNTPIQNIAMSAEISRIGRVTAIGLSTTSFLLYYQVLNSDHYYLNKAEVTTTGLIFEEVLVRGQALASDLFLVGTVHYVLSVLPSDTQSTFYLLDESGDQTAKAMLDLAGFDATEYRLPSAVISGSDVGLAVPQNIEFLSVNGESVFIQGLSKLILDFSGDLRLQTPVLGENMHVTGGFLQAYDGENVHELGFNYAPEGVTLTPLVSFIGLATTQESAGTSGLETMITFPVNQDHTKPDGALIKAGEFITYGGNIEGIDGGGGAYVGPSPNLGNYFWFSVDGDGTDPALGGFWVGTEVAILSTDTAAHISDTFLAAIKTTSMFTGVPGTYVTLTQPQPNQVFIQSFGGDSQSHMTMNTLFDLSFGATDTVAPGTGPTTTVLSCSPGLLITGGQYFTFRTRTVTPAVVNHYVWFTVDGVGDDPKPPGATQGIVVHVLSTDTEKQVASKLKTALDLPGYRYSTTANGNQVALTNTDNGNFLPDSPGENPLIGGVGMGYLGIGDFPGVPGDADPAWDSYEYRAIYECVDGQGQLDRSPPSVPAILKVPSWDVTRRQVIKITLDTLRLTAKPAADIAIFRSEANGTDVHYRVTSPVDLLVNDKTVDTATFQDVTGDVELVSNETLYSDAEIENDAPPAPTFLLNHRDRLWAIIDPQVVWYSKEFVGGLCVGFNADQTIRFDPLGGDLVGLGSLDANMIAFEETKIWAVAGDGPSNAGEGAPFGQPVLISSNVGCRDPKSICITPDGLLFKSMKGWMLLDRSLQVRPEVGVQVRQFDADVCTSALALDGTHQIRCLSEDGTTLLYDFFARSWGTFTNHLGVDALMVDGVYHYLRADGHVYIENPGNYFDDDIGYSLKIQLAWFKFSGLQGFEVFWMLFFKGFFPGTNPIRVTLDYDYGQPVASPKQQILAYNELAGVLGDDTYGAGVVYGDGITYGAGGVSIPEPDQIQFKVYPKYHSCESIRITLEDLPPFDDNNKYYLSAVDCEVGIEQGGYRIPQGQQAIG